MRAALHQLRQNAAFGFVWWLVQGIHPDLDILILDLFLQTTDAKGRPTSSTSFDWHTDVGVAELAGGGVPDDWGILCTVIVKVTQCHGKSSMQINVPGSIIPLETPPAETPNSEKNRNFDLRADLPHS